ncbi:MAG TPA: aminotransferase class III-fold pyridoxal phosphate-dependent enzyme [Ktedonobacteraceae bacterium]|nr:aminotransferase class III-fold pyridoxal phosphate-dependent enzyme [Ktedonobacteraceae bacterium]
MTQSEKGASSTEERLQVLSTYIESPLNNEHTERLLFGQADGYRLYDHTGKDYIDLINGKGSVILGHNDQDVTLAIQAFLTEKRNIITGPAETILTLANQISEDIALPDARVSFYTTGTAVCRVAATTARQVTGKHMILSAGYHGWDPMWEQDGEFLQPNHDGIVDFYFVPELLEQALQRYGSQTALVIIAPDYTYLQPETLQNIFALSRSYGVPICCDDVKQGYRHRQGSSLPLAVSEQADLYTFSKGLANGLRISCIVGRSVLMEGTKELTYTSYYDMLPVAAAVATLQKMRTNQGYDHLNTIGKKLVTELNALFQRYNLPAQANGHAPIFQFVFADEDIEETFYKEAVTAGLLLFEGDNQTISFCFNEHTVQELLERFERVVTVLVRQFARKSGQSITPETTFRTAWNMIDGAADVLPYEQKVALIQELR